MNRILKDELGVANEIPSVFIDSHYTKGNSEEVGNFTKYTTKLFDFAKTKLDTPFECKDVKAAKLELRTLTESLHQEKTKNQRLERDKKTFERLQKQCEEKMSKLNGDHEQKIKEMNDEIESLKNKKEDGMDGKGDPKKVTGKEETKGTGSGGFVLFGIGMLFLGIGVGYLIKRLSNEKKANADNDDDIDGESQHASDDDVNRNNHHLRSSNIEDNEMSSCTKT